jgi:hypothetical protein
MTPGVNPTITNRSARAVKTYNTRSSQVHITIFFYVVKKLLSTYNNNSVVVPVVNATFVELPPGLITKGKLTLDHAKQ